MIIKMFDVRNKGELALMGKTIKCVNNEEAVKITDYILKVLYLNHSPLDGVTSGQVLLDEYINRYGKNTVKYIVTNTLMGQFRCITFVLDSGDEDEPFPEDLATEDGVFSYVYNVSAPDLSELGYCFFEKRSDNYYHRIG